MIGKIGMSMLFLAILAVVCTPAQAVLITNGATTVLNHGFEGYTVGEPPWLPSWDHSAGGVTVESVIAPGPYEGAKYLKLQRLGYDPYASAGFDSQTSGTVKLTFMANTGSGSEVGLTGFMLKDGTSTVFQIDFAGATVSWLGPRGVYAYSSGGGGWQPLGLDWTNDNVWKKVEFEYTIGAPTATVKVDGVTATGVKSMTGGAISSFNQLYYYTSSSYGSTLNVDAVPEPATMVLLSLCGLGLLRRRKA